MNGETRHRVNEALDVLAPWRGVDSVLCRLRRSWWLRAEEVRSSLETKADERHRRTEQRATTRTPSGAAP